MKFEFIRAEKAIWPVSVLCDVLRVSRSGYYAWKGRPASARARTDGDLIVEIKAAHKAGRGHYGSPRVHRALRKNGRHVGKKRVARLMQREGIVATRRKKFRVTTDSKHSDPIAPNILDREFDVALPNKAWVTDVTYVWTHQGWLYLAAILDLCSRRVVGWATSGCNDRQLALDALDCATTTRHPCPGLLHHSDRGSVGEINQSSQHHESEVLRCRIGNGGGRIEPDGHQCVRRDGRRRRDEKLNSGSGRRSLEG